MEEALMGAPGNAVSESEIVESGVEKFFER
jgi:hypothetical protein